MTTTQRSRRRTTAVLAGALAAVALAGACGEAAPEAEVTSIAEALGLDGTDFREREAKVQEAVRKCMEDEGFDYVPMDPSAMNVQIRSPGSEDNAEFRRTKGYGITTTFGDRAEAPEDRGSDPNQKVREAMSEEERAAYDKALFGSAAKAGGNGEFSVRIGPGPAGGSEVAEATEAPDLSEAGCFGKAQESVGRGNRVERIGPKLQEMEERISSDPRMVKANAAWAACMSDSGFDFEKPEDIPAHLFGKLRDLQDDDNGGGPDDPAAPPGAITVGGPPPDSPELAALQQEELALAKADDACSDRTGRRETAKKVRAEAEKQFLADNPDLGGDDAGDGEG